LTGATPPPGLRTVTRSGHRFRVYVTTLPDAGLGNLAKLEAAGESRVLHTVRGVGFVLRP
jgi:hypothetical protein